VPSILFPSTLARDAKISCVRYAVLLVSLPKLLGTLVNTKLIKDLAAVQLGWQLIIRLLSRVGALFER